jgi:hypothetical protein
MKARGIATVAITLTLCTPARANKINPADYTLTAKILSVEASTRRHSSPVTNPNTGVITGSTTGYSTNDREEIQIGNTIYITNLWGRGGINGKVGDSFPARIGKKHGLPVIYLLGKDKHGRPKEVTLEIVGQRIP